jgi:microcystin-dependent protein
MGCVFDYTGPSTSMPSFCILPYGQAISRATYAAYFAKVGTTYGAGDGSTTFNVPDLRGRVVAGKDDMGGVSADRLTAISGSLNGDTLGAVGGQEGVTLSAANIDHKHNATFLGNYDAGLNALTLVTASNDVNDMDSNTAHNNVQPTIIANKVLYVGV